MRVGMNVKRGLLAAALLAGFVAPPALAETETLSCVLKDRRNSYYQPATVRLTVDFYRGKVLVEDELTRKVRGGPIAGKVETRNGKRTTIVWTVTDVPNDPKTIAGYRAATIVQRLTIWPDGKGMLTGDIRWAAVAEKPQLRSDVICTPQK